jgi:plasmid stabilization system protein ParE
MPQVVWLPEALEDTERLRLFLEDKNPKAAARAGHVLEKGAKLLARFPELGVTAPNGNNCTTFPFSSRYFANNSMHCEFLKSVDRLKLACQGLPLVGANR